jgi:Asp-tRNA(Asn)/Glu-tRNA(Gln) amidotransferase A subunit family amidase
MRANYVYNWDMDIDTLSLTITQVLQDEETRLGLTRACYRQIERLNPTINAFITVIPPSTTLRTGLRLRSVALAPPAGTMPLRED